jgi:hypothetical protein
LADTPHIIVIKCYGTSWRHYPPNGVYARTGYFSLHILPSPINCRRRLAFQLPLWETCDTIGARTRLSHRYIRVRIELVAMKIDGCAITLLGQAHYHKWIQSFHSNDHCTHPQPISIGRGTQQKPRAIWPAAYYDSTSRGWLVDTTSLGVFPATSYMAYMAYGFKLHINKITERPTMLPCTRQSPL